MRPTTLGAVVARADTDEDAADALVAEVELDLLETALDQERGVRVGDRAHAFERHAGRGRNHQSLADPDVDRTPGMALKDVKLVEVALADVRDDDGHSLVVVEQVRGHSVEALAHRFGHYFGST